MNACGRIIQHGTTCRDRTKVQVKKHRLPYWLVTTLICPIGAGIVQGIAELTKGRYHGSQLRELALSGVISVSRKEFAYLIVFIGKRLILNKQKNKRKKSFGAT